MALCVNILLLLITILTATTSHLLVLSQQFRDDAKTIDQVVRDCAFQTFDRRRRTAVLYQVPMPANLSSVSTETVRFRTGSLRRYGARVKEFSIEPGVVFIPHTKRIVAVHQNLGNLSSAYSSSLNMSEYHFVSPVLGLLSYNARSSFKKPRSQPQAEILVTKNPIRIDFSGLVADLQEQKQALCVLFDLDGNVHVSKQISLNVCGSWQQGHFALIAPKNHSSSSSSSSSVVVVVGGGKKLSRWKIAAVAAASALLATVLLVLIVVAVASVRKRRSRMAERERRTYEDEALQVSMVDHVRAPRATVARTAPVLEDDRVPTV